MSFSTNALQVAVASSMNVLMRMPSRVQRATSRKRGVDRLVHRRVVEEHLAVGAVEVGGRLAVGDHDDLLGARLAGEHAAG